MIYISEQIKEALKTLAEIKRRPPYELCIVKSVLSAYRNDEYHSLKAELDEILEWKFPNVKRSRDVFREKVDVELASDEQYQEFVAVVSSFTGSIKMLACLADFDPSTLSTLKRSGAIKKAYFEKLQPHFAAVLAEKAKHSAPKPKAEPKPKVKKPKNNNGQKVMRQIMSASVAEAMTRKGVAA
jgi:hypothetical protein